ncbi:MAG: trigger factor [Bacilli bacterium]|nr:trigger factor [Bacilli bacterium]
MSVKVEKISGCKVSIKFVVDSEKFDVALDQAFAKKVQEVEVKGFRKGKLPRDMYNAKFGEESLYEEAVNFAVNEAYQEALEKHKLDVVGRPELDVDFATVGKGKKLKFTIAVEVWPEVELGQYKELEIVKESVEVSEKDVEDYINRQKKNHAELVVIEGKSLENGHTAIFDFEGFVDGVAFEGGKAENYSLEIGSHQFIPGFEEQMIGLNVGEEKTLNVKFPENYQQDALKGKEAVFNVKLHEIKERVLPELNEEFVKDIELKDVETVDQYLVYVKETLAKEKEEASANKFNDDVLTLAVNNAKLELPQALVDEEIERQVQQMEHQAKSYNIPMELLLQYYGIENLEQYKKAITPSAEAGVRQRAVFLKVAEVEKVKISEKEYDAEFQAVADEYKKSIDEIKKTYAKEMIAPYLKMRKAIDLIKNSAIAK